MNLDKPIRVTTRGSQLALTQVEILSVALENLLGKKPEIEIIKVVTKGDKHQSTPLYNIGGKGLFIREVERVLLDEQADVAVHSLKDVPAIEVDSLFFAAYLTRENPADCLLSHNHLKLADLPHGAKVGTCSLRRLAQLKEQRPDLDIHPLRGNVNTRLKKLHDQEFSAILLAAAGLSRLQMNHEISEEFSPSKFTPAGGQGIIGVQISEKNRDSHLHQLLQQVSCELATAAAFAERHFLRKLGGSCRSPIGIHAVPNSTGWRIDAFLAGGPNGPYLREGRNCSKDNLMETADQLADLILAQGGAAMIKEQWQLTQNQEVSQSAEKSKNV